MFPNWLNAESNKYDVNSLLLLFEKIFIVHRLSPFYTNKTLEIVKNPKIYFPDNGLRNSILNNFSILRTGLGSLYEAFVFQELVKQDFYLKFWRSKSKSEVDFIFKFNGGHTPVEVKRGVSKTKPEF